MILVALAALVSIACIVVSARRLIYAFTPTALDPQMLTEAVKGASLEDVERAIARVPEATWEKTLVAALRRREPDRTAEVNEALLDLEWRAARWARVPRVCASVATSLGFLLATFALRQGLLDPNPEGIDQLLVRAVNVLAVGIVGATFCVAAHVRAGKTAKNRLVLVDALVERLETLK